MLSGQHVKMQIFVPVEYSDRVRVAIGEAGGGKMGNYSHCVSVTRSTGYFMPLKGAKPAIGEMGKLEKVEEDKLEFICERYEVEKIMREVEKVHPYEEIACDIIPLLERE